MAIAIRPVGANDLEAYVGQWNATWPSLATTADELRRDDQTLPAEMRELRWLAWANGESVGFGAAHRPASCFHLGRWWIDVGVASDRRRQGIGSELYETALGHLQSEGYDHIDTRVREDDKASIAFAESRGFVESRRDFESMLDLRGIDEIQMVGWSEKPGIRIASLAELDSAEFRRHFHEVFEIVRQDVPRAEPPVRLTFEFFQEQVLDEPSILPNGWFFALDGDEMVGFTGVYRGANEGWLDQWLTGVRREYRGRGIALALKARVARWGRATGFTTIRTDNSSKNAAMLAVNDRCGFVRSLAILTMRKGSPSDREGPSIR